MANHTEAWQGNTWMEDLAQPAEPVLAQPSAADEALATAQEALEVAKDALVATQTMTREPVAQQYFPAVLQPEVPSGPLIPGQPWADTASSWIIVVATLFGMLFGGRRLMSGLQVRRIREVKPQNPVEAKTVFGREDV